MPITKRDLKKKLAEVNKLSNSIPVSTGSSTGNSNTINETETDKLILTTKTITKINGTKCITSDGTSAELFNPLPGVFWKCMGNPDTKGNITLQKKLTGLFIISESNSYCLGVQGDTDEFELRIVLGKNELRINKTFLNIISEHIVKNGLEE